MAIVGDVSEPSQRWRDLLDAGLSSLSDPRPIDFREADEVGVRPVRSPCQATAGEPVRLRHELNRNAFLCGCLDFTENEPIEHLIAGFGRHHGRTTRIEAVAHRLGSADQVDIGPDVRVGAPGHQQRLGPVLFLVSDVSPSRDSGPVPHARSVRHP